MYPSTASLIAEKAKRNQAHQPEIRIKLAHQHLTPPVSYMHCRRMFTPLFATCPSIFSRPPKDSNIHSISEHAPQLFISGRDIVDESASGRNSVFSNFGRDSSGSTKSIFPSARQHKRVSVDDGAGRTTVWSSPCVCRLDFPRHACMYIPRSSGGIQA